MKTTKISQKSVERSPIQMMIVSFVIIFAFITGTILFMYFKWFANDNLGAPAAVNVVGVEKKLKILSSDELQSFYSYVEETLGKPLKTDVAELIPLEDGFVLITSVLSNKKDKLVYLESNGIVENIVVFDLSSQTETQIKTQTIKSLHGYGDLTCHVSEFPIIWSANDKKIVVERFQHECPSSGPDRRYFDVIDLEDFNQKILFVTGISVHSSIFEDNFENVLYIKLSENNLYCDGLGTVVFDQIIRKNIESSEETVLVANENEVYSDLLLLSDGTLQYAVQTIYKGVKDSVTENCYIIKNFESKETRTIQFK